MTTPAAAPPFDPELVAVLEAVGAELPSSITPELIPLLRQRPADAAVEEMVAQIGAVHEERSIPGHGGDEILLSIWRDPSRTTPGPALYVMHGGGMVAGDRFTGVTGFLPYIASHGAVVVSVEYRLAPEFPDPVPVEDCYAGLVWTAEHAAELGIDPDRIVVGGASAGGGLTAGVTLMARDRQGPPLRASLLIYPMLDDRNETVSSHQYQGVGVWDRTSNLMGWEALLGDRRGTDDVSVYAAPARAQDLSALPPTFIDVGSAEAFRDEDVAYASRIWACGGAAELHVWPGGFHGFDTFAPQSRLATAMVAARDRWLSLMLAG